MQFQGAEATRLTELEPELTELFSIYIYQYPAPEYRTSWQGTCSHYSLLNIGVSLRVKLRVVH